MICINYEKAFDLGGSTNYVDTVLEILPPFPHVDNFSFFEIKSPLNTPWNRQLADPPLPPKCLSSFWMAPLDVRRFIKLSVVIEYLIKICKMPDDSVESDKLWIIVI